MLGEHGASMAQYVGQHVRRMHLIIATNRLRQDVTQRKRVAATLVALFSIDMVL
jgi:hypothetical protein